MSDIPSVPSLKNLVQSSLFGAPSVHTSGNAGGGGSRGLNSKTPNKTYSVDPIQRNFSTKSFSTKLDHEEEKETLPSIRKCETVIAITGMAAASSNTAGASSSSAAKASKSGVIKSPLSHVFKHLSGSKNSKSNSLVEETTEQQAEPIKHPPPASETGRPCESPYPVSIFLSHDASSQFAAWAS